MNSRNIVLVAIIIGLMQASPSAALMSYSPVIIGGTNGGTVITWNIADCPDVPFAWGWMGEGAWLASVGDEMSFTVLSVEDDVNGELTLGNMTLVTNDTTIARELVLGVWGLTQFFPGLVIETDTTSITELNETAHASAQRVKGNYLNGTMHSRIEEMTLGGSTYTCIVFDYEQDPTGYGEPQRTTLAYDLNTGVLVWANTSYSFGTPYILTLELSQIVVPQQLHLETIVAVGAAVTLLAVLVVFARRRR